MRSVIVVIFTLFTVRQVKLVLIVRVAMVVKNEDGRTVLVGVQDSRNPQDQKAAALANAIDSHP